MCDFKKYSKNIEKERESLSLRVTFFSKSSFVDDFVRKNSEVLGDSFSVRQLTEKEGEIVDVDQISHILEIPLDYVLKDKNVYIFNNLEFNGGACRAMVSRYFIFIQMKGQGGSVKLAKQKPMQLLKLDGFENSIDLFEMSMLDYYVLGSDKDNLWDVFDENAFGDVDLNKMVESRYADAHKRDEFEASLVRNIVRRENSDGKTIYQVFLKSIASYSDPTIELVGSLENIEKMQKCCEKEVTRCFSKVYCQ